MQGMTFDAFTVTDNRANPRQRDSLQAALNAAKSFAENPEEGCWLVLGGTTGVGKTHLAAAIWNDAIQKGRPAFFAFVPELLDHLRYTFAPTSDVTYDELFERVKGEPLLILDDLGAQVSTPWAKEKLYQLLVHRHNARLPTVITMGQGVSVDPPIISRLRDTVAATPVDIEAPDYRDGSPPAADEGGPRRRLKPVGPLGGGGPHHRPEDRPGLSQQDHPDIQLGPVDRGGRRRICTLLVERLGRPAEIGYSGLFQGN